MKKKISYLFLIGLLAALTLHAQEDPDQNPNAAKSAARYQAISDSLLAGQGTTYQQTYKAYDWYEAKQERKALRRERRHQERMANPYYGYDNWFYPSIGFSYWGGRHSHWGWSPYIGINTGGYWW
ncbi:hypothetical protein GCM10023231_14920 [Olivibacter ginsenosidimutans]|uniref:DUF3300 domain-containing protein n=1 Tax=Olivibacter ginsenosidimutans TaxID=1176537 RepID=A0ABP9AY28_9SPHI